MYASTTTDVSNSTALVKIWRTDQQDRDGKPKLIQQLRIFAKFPEEAITAFAVSKDVGHMAVGLSNGAIILFRSEIKVRNYSYIYRYMYDVPAYGAIVCFKKYVLKLYLCKIIERKKYRVSSMIIS
jgi:hypothetical protein